MSALYLMLPLVAILLVLVGLWWLARRQDQRWQQFLESQRQDQALEVVTRWLQDMRASLDRSTDTMQRQLESTSRTIGERLDHAAQVISEMSRELGQVQEIGHHLRDLQDLLRSPKLRGNIGEQILKDLLGQVLPRENFKAPYKFKQGQVVDATIITDRGLIPVDAKFPLENFRRLIRAESEPERQRLKREFVQDVKKHIDDISRKYILPREGTLDFAVMYVPAEAVYYEIIMGDEDLNAYAQTRKVLLASPNSFYYFLQVILMGLEGRRIEEASQRILESLNTIRQDAVKFGEDLRILTTHLTNAKNALDRVNNAYWRLSNAIDDTRSLRVDHTRPA